MTIRLPAATLATPSVEHIARPQGCSVIRGLLTREECVGLLSQLTFPELLDTRLNGGDREIDQQRIVYRLKEVNEGLANDFYERLKPLVPAVVRVEEDDSELGAFSKGDWEFVGINEMISCYRYTSGGRFSKHRDGIYHRHEDCRSLYTVLVYLNNDFSGGRTTVYCDDDPTFSLEVEPEPGLAFMMLQRVMHEGKPVESGEKYAIRLDLMYQRQGIYDETRLENNRLAQEYLQLAIDFERAKNGPKAIEYYKKAFRLNPALERIM